MSSCANLPCPYSEQDRCRLPSEVRGFERTRPRPPGGAPRGLLREQPRGEALDARPERVGALLEARPGVLGLRLGRLRRLLELVAGVLGTLDDGVPDALGGFLDAGPDLAVPDRLGTLFHLTGRRLHLRIVGGEAMPGERGRDDQGGSDDEFVAHG